MRVKPLLNYSMRVSQMSKIISKKYNDKIEIIFAIDKSIYLNATQTAKNFNKKPDDWLQKNILKLF